MNTTLLLTGLLLLAPAAYTVDLATDAAAWTECMGTPCDEVNLVCEKLLGAQCLGYAAAGPDCMGPVCDQVNAVCERVGGTPCLDHVAGAEGPACYGTPCDEVNRVCGLLGDGQGQCLGAAAGVDLPADCASSVCTEVNERVCRPVFGIDCVYATGDGTGAEPEAAAPCTGYWLCETVNEVCGNCIPRASP